MSDDIAYFEYKRKRKVNQIIVDSAIWSSVGGIVPIPFFDIASVMAIQLKMINELSYEYDVDFRQDLNKSILISLLGGIATDYFGKLTFSVLASRFMFGADFKQVATSLWAGALTYAVGRTFQTHYESGRGLADFNIHEYRQLIQEHGREGYEMLKNKYSGKSQV